MKKQIALFMMILTMCFVLTACNSGNSNGNENVEETGGSSDANIPPITETSDVLIAYFSCTNTTEAVAEHIRAKTKGTLYEIVPEIPYTADDLKYYTGCRADREQDDVNARPAINVKVTNMEKYDTVFLGYPIWHGQAPRIISTFLESYDFTDKKIVPFCTSASSGIGSSDTNLHSLAPDAEWMTGRRFSSGDSQNTVTEWIESLDIARLPEQEQITTMYLNINGSKIEVALAENSSVDALIEILKQGDITYTANDYGGFEKVGSLGHTLPTNDSQITTQAGDVILYSGNRIVLFYGSNSWSYTRLGKVKCLSVAELRSLLGAGNGSVQVTISLK